MRVKFILISLFFPASSSSTFKVSTARLCCLQLFRRCLFDGEKKYFGFFVRGCLDNGFEDNYPFVTAFCFASSLTWTFSFFFLVADVQGSIKEGEHGEKSIFVAHQKQTKPDEPRRPNNNHSSPSLLSIVLIFIRIMLDNNHKI